MGAIITLVVSTSTCTFNTTAVIAYKSRRYESFEYGSYGNQTKHVAQCMLMAPEGAGEGSLSASSMNAVKTMLLALMPPSGHVVLTTDCYRC